MIVVIAIRVHRLIGIVSYQDKSQSGAKKFKYSVRNRPSRPETAQSEDVHLLGGP